MTSPRPLLRLLGFACFLVSGAVSANAQGQDAISTLMNQFENHCGAVLSAPEGYLEDRIAAGDASPIAVGVSEDQLVYTVVSMEMTQMFAINVAAIEDRTYVYCFFGTFADGPSTDTEALNRATVAALENEIGPIAVGGQLTVSGLFLNSGGTDKTIFEYHLPDWPMPGEIVTVEVAPVGVRMDASKVLPRPLALDD